MQYHALCYRDPKYTSVDSGTLAHSFFTCMENPSHYSPYKTHAGVTQYIEKSDSEKAFSSHRTWASLLTENNHIVLMLWKRWKWQFTRLLVNKYQDKKWILVSIGSYRYPVTPVWNKTKAFNLVLRIYFAGKPTTFFGGKNSLKLFFLRVIFRSFYF